VIVDLSGIAIYAIVSPFFAKPFLISDELQPSEFATRVEA
jgi:hypothetical protein